MLLIQRQLPLHRLDVGNYLLYSAANNITAEGLRLLPNYNMSQIKHLNLGINILIKDLTILVAVVSNY
jgi:hypothetical protein